MTSSDNQEQEFLEWYDKYADAIYRYCYFRVYQTEQAKDLVQEVFTRTWQYLKKGYVIENGRAFLYRVALHCIIRASQRPTPLSLEKLEEESGDIAIPATVGDEESILQGIESKRIRELLNTLLDEKDREVILLRYINELSPHEIAEITGESENVISVRLHRAIKKFRALLQPYE